ASDLPSQRSLYLPCYFRSLAHFGYAAHAAVFRFQHAQRAGRVSRVLLVLLHQRTSIALPEPALSARLQYGAARGLLAPEPAVAFSLERLSARSGQAQL